jgi:hypothetical protein
VSSPAAAAKRPDALRHVDALFGEPRRNVIDWDPIERDFDDLMRVVLPVAAGKISPVALLPAVDALPAQELLHGIPRGREGHQNHAAASVPVGSAAASANHRGDEQGRARQQLLSLLPVRQCGHHASG